MVRFLALMAEMYPTFLNGRNETTTLDIWAALAEDETLAEMTDALMTYACRDDKGFPPPIGMLKKLVWQQRNENISEQIAWEMVKAQFSGSSAHPTENFAKLPQVVQKCVGTPSTLMKWGQMEEGELESVIASQFRRSYRDAVQQKRDMDVLPNSLRGKYTEYVLPSPALQVEMLSAPDESENGVPCPPEVKAKLDALRKQLDTER